MTLYIFLLLKTFFISLRTIKLESISTFETKKVVVILVVS